ncbi:MAG: xylose isomerase [Candidatus Bipolaricaulota bacterium]|nr:xylose isomerase [Candidatus Bipolaricaulota bacterium]MBS3791506.1 xylose isomerase [Candidatus Bipolaricaulota bacterium]
MKEYFPEVGKIEYKGRKSEDPLSFKHYNPEETVGSSTMSEQLRFSVAYWHSFTARGADPFGAKTITRLWDEIDDPMERAKARAEAAFEFMGKMGLDYFCFHDRDVAPPGNTLAETNDNLDEIVSRIEELMEDYDVDLLWGTANLFEHPRYAHGAATSPNADVFAYASAQVKKALEVTKRLGGSNYVFWGGREGYKTLLNTDLGLEQDNLARFLAMAVDHAKKIGFDGQLLLEPKPMEPTKHQYDFDVEHVAAFLRKYDLEDHFKANIEANHATLAGHNFHHELAYARENDLLGSVDANQGDLLLGWDTDEFPTDVYSTTLAAYEILKNNGLAPGGLNFDAKVRRESFEARDLFIAHIAGMDTFAFGLKVAQRLKEDGVLEEFRKERYSSFQESLGNKIKDPDTDFEMLEEHVMENVSEPIELESGRQEKLRGLLNSYITTTE